MERVGDTGELNLRYPIFAVVTAEPGGEENLVVIEADGEDCLPLFRTRELAELYLEQAEDADAPAPLALHACRGDAELAHLLEQLPGSVAHVVWDATAQAQVLRVTAVRALLGVVRDQGQ
jgi:hypothetical protein